MIPEGLRRLLLVGFMGSGKTTVGRRLAQQLGWRFIDFDDVIEQEEDESVSAIFSSRGERYFREVEARVAGRLLEEDDVVLGSGGGWAAVAGRLESLPGATASVWLKVSPEEAVRRAESEPGSRPLLDGPQPLDRARTLLEERAPIYATARWAVDTEGISVEDVSARILGLLADAHTRSDTE